MEVLVELKTKIWMTGTLQWFAYIGDEEIYLGGREVPCPLQENDTWTNELGDTFAVVHGEIRLMCRTEPPERCW
jgi:hypothetical protein